LALPAADHQAPYGMKMRHFQIADETGEAIAYFLDPYSRQRRSGAGRGWIIA